MPQTLSKGNASFFSVTLYIIHILQLYVILIVTFRNTFIYLNAYWYLAVAISSYVRIYFYSMLSVINYEAISPTICECNQLIRVFCFFWILSCVTIVLNEVSSTSHSQLVGQNWIWIVLVTSSYLCPRISFVINNLFKYF